LQSAREQWQAQAITQDSQFITHYRQLANELQIAIAITYLEHIENVKCGETFHQNPRQR
jgi:hypothetical protein